MAAVVNAAKLASYDVGPESMCRNHVAVTALDATTYDPPLRVVFAAVAGTLVLTDMNDADATYTVPAGAVINWLLVKKVKTASTATGIVGGW